MNRQTSRGSATTPTRGFTLVELLVVILIIFIVSAVTLPVIIPLLGSRQVNEAARLVQSSLAGARDAAIRANDRRGIRLLPDTTLFTPMSVNATGQVTNYGILTYSRMIPIESAPDYTDGAVSIINDDYVNGVYSNGNPMTGTYYSPYPTGSYYPPATTATGQYFFAPSPFLPQPVPKGKVLRVEQCAATVQTTTNGVITIPNPPTNWWWNVRVGDKIQINNSGRFYTIVGPLTILPKGSDPTKWQNTELFVNDGLPGTPSQLGRFYGNNSAKAPVEFLYVVNGQDDDNDGYIDDGFDGVDNDYFNGVDDVSSNSGTSFGEWETEVWVGSLQVMNNASNLLTYNNDPTNPGFNLPYTITRRAVPSPGARETVLPGSVVIDATTWNSTQERSRLPIDKFSYTIDILVDPSGQVVPQTLYSSNSNFPMTSSFYHFWITDRADVYPTRYDFNPQLYPSPPNPPFPQLPMPSGFSTPYNSIVTPFGTSVIPGSPNIWLKKDRQLVTMFTKTGQIVTKSLETFHGLNQLSSSDPGDANAPFYEAQLGIREAK